MHVRPIKYRTGHGGYVSEFTNFIDDLLQQHPEIVDDQDRGFNIFWDRDDVEFEELKKAEKAAVPVKPYPYS